MIVDRRLDSRKRVIWNGRLYRDGDVLECEIVDVSAEGARARLAVRMVVNATVVLEIDRLGMFPGEISWHAANEIGVRFLESAGMINERLRGTEVRPIPDL
jgi:hypothetical protein